MPVQRYSVNQHPIETLLTWIKSDAIAIPEIQRPFVWDAAKVRDFIDSLYNGYPVGYLIAWQNPDVRWTTWTRGCQTLRQSPVWRERDDLLRTVPGVGEQLSLTLMAYLPELGTLDRRQVARPGGRGSLQPGQWHPARQTRCLGRALPSAGRPLHGDAVRNPLQPRHLRLLPEAAGGWQTEEGGPRRVYAQTARHPQLHAQTSLSLARHNSGSCESFLLTLNTVAFFVVQNPVATFLCG